MAEITQIQMAKTLKITPAYMSEILSGKHPISRPLAEKLADEFPEKTYSEWRKATPEDLRRAFAQLPTDKQGEAA
jgi:plasmid maintenance system antidote protein VapI